MDEGMNSAIKTRRSGTSSTYARKPSWGVLFCLCTLAFAVGGKLARPQDVGHVFDNDQIQKAAQSLEAQLKQSNDTGTGLAEARLDAVTFVAVRVKSGRAEIHKTSDDVFVVLSGEATLVTGGTVSNPSGTEEIRGDSIVGVHKSNSKRAK
jgi:mannose-6-phosphate isomerase-like protein (cupin superfamily)